MQQKVQAGIDDSGQSAQTPVFNGRSMGSQGSNVFLRRETKTLDSLCRCVD